MSAIRDMFNEIVSEHIHREGIDKLMDWCDDNDFFTSPCSAKYHLCWEGGLAEHSINVYNRLKKLVHLVFTDGTMYPYSDETLAICALFHDICKCDLYFKGKRWHKDDAGKWVTVDCYEYNAYAMPGHGDKSVFILNKYIRLTDEEIVAIRWHMSTWEDGKIRDVGNVYKLSPLALLLHMADELATFIDEKE